MLKYIVSLSYHKFEFYNAQEAIEFAETAKLHYRDERDDDLRVEIDIEVEEQPTFVEPENNNEEVNTDGLEF